MLNAEMMLSTTLFYYVCTQINLKVIKKTKKASFQATYLVFDDHYNYGKKCHRDIYHIIARTDLCLYPNGSRYNN